MGRRARVFIAALLALAGCHHALPAVPAPSPPAPRLMPAEEPGRTWITRSRFSQLRFQNPVFAVMPPRDPRRWFVGEREGRVLAVEDRDDARDAVTVLDLRKQTLGWQDCGLLNMVFHPEFGQAGSPNRGYVYVWYNYTRDPAPGPGSPMQGHPSANRLSRFTIPDGAGAADPASELVLIEQARTNTDHHGGGMFFHPADGFLYVGVGDGGHEYKEGHGAYVIEGADEAQRLDRELLSGVLRIDVDRRGGTISHPIRRQPRHGHTQGYFIPSDNPWLDPRGGLLEEFFAVGLRNPHRMTVDRETGQIFAGDVGEGRIEEIDRIERQGNYQWNYREGELPYRPRPAKVPGVEHGPLYSYPHHGFSSVIGGFVYRGRAHPELAGQYLFGDTGSGEIWALDVASASPVKPRLLLRLPQEHTAYAGLASFAVDAAGEIYLCLLGRNAEATGTLAQLVRLDPSRVPPAPATLSATGFFRDTAALVADQALFPYQVNAPFWSDHAIKRRWLYVPRDKKVAFAPEGEWSFPAGTIAVKHFDLALDERDPARQRRLETRVIVLDAQGGAYGRTYKWRPDGRDADLLAAPVRERLTMTTREPLGPLTPVPLSGAGKGTLAERQGGGWTLESPADGTLFASRSTDGDFDVAAAVDQVEGGAGGLMLRHAGSASSLFAAWEPAGGRLRVERRGGGAPAVRQIDARGPWIRLRRSDGALAVFTGEDGHLWTEVAAGLPMADSGPVDVGLAVAAESGVARANVSAAINCAVRDHYYPSIEECMVCHTASAHFVLGASTRQWNSEIQGQNQLVLASRRGLLDAEVRPEDPGHWKRLVPIEDRSAPVVDRVRSYLDANCSQCHRAGMVVGVGIDARYDVPFERQGLLRSPIRWPAVPTPDELVVAPRDLERSRLYARVAHHDMPPVGGLLTHDAAVDLLREWILGLEGSPALASVQIRWSAGRLELVHPDPAAILRYTTDGSLPGPETPRYAGPVVLRASSMVRAAAYRDGFVRSRISSRYVTVPPR